MRSSSVAKGQSVCPWQHVRLFDNFIRPLLHNTKAMVGRYVRDGMTALDVGCGKGFASLGLARLVGKSGLIIAADLQPEMLEMVRDRAEKAGLSDRIQTHLCQADCIGVHRRVDFVLAFWMVHEVPDTHAFLKEVFCLLKPGGHFLIAEPRFHVSRNDFERTLKQAQSVDFKVVCMPFVVLSRAVVLAK